MMKKKLFGSRLCFNEEVGPSGKKIAISSWPNHWQMLDVALTLRGLDYAAVKKFYSGPVNLVPAGQGSRRTSAPR